MSVKIGHIRGIERIGLTLLDEFSNFLFDVSRHSDFVVLFAFVSV